MMTLKERQTEFLDELADELATCVEQNLVYVGIAEGVDEYIDTSLQLLKNDIFIGFCDEFVEAWSWSCIDLASKDFMISVPVFSITFSGVSGFSVSYDEGNLVKCYVGDIVETWFSPTEIDKLFTGRLW